MTSKNDFFENTRTTNSQLFATKKFPITIQSDREQKPAFEVLNVVLLRYPKENKIEFEIAKGEIMRFSNGVEVIGPAYEDAFKPSVLISLEGFKTLEGDGFVLEKGARIGIGFMKPNEVTEKTVSSLNIELACPHKVEDPMHLFHYVLDALQESMIMAPKRATKVTQEEVSHILEMLKIARIETDNSRIPYVIAELENEKKDVLLRFVHKLIKAVEEEMSPKAPISQPQELQRKVPEHLPGVNSVA